MAVENLQQLDQRQGRAGLAGLVAREGVDPAAEQFGGFALVEGKLLADSGDEAGVDRGGVDLFVEGQHGGAGAGRLGGA